MGEEKRQASDRPQRGRGRPAGCRGGFEGGARGCLTLPSEAHRKSFLGQAAACRNVCAIEKAFWAKGPGTFGPEEKRQASDRPQRGRGRPAGCRGAFEGGAGCLTSPLEAHRKSFLGQAAACRNVCGPGPVGEEKRQASDRPQRGRGRCRLPRRV